MCRITTKTLTYRNEYVELWQKSLNFIGINMVNFEQKSQNFIKNKSVKWWAKTLKFTDLNMLNCDFKTSIFYRNMHIFMHIIPSWYSINPNMNMRKTLFYWIWVVNRVNNPDWFSAYTCRSILCMSYNYWPILTSRFWNMMTNHLLRWQKKKSFLLPVMQEQKKVCGCSHVWWLPRWPHRFSQEDEEDEEEARSHERRAANPNIRCFKNPR